MNCYRVNVVYTIMTSIAWTVTSYNNTYAYRIGNPLHLSVDDILFSLQNPSTTVMMCPLHGSLPQPAKVFQKEKSLWRKLPFFKNKSQHSSDHSLTWKVVREDLMKPVWRHEESRCITRPHKFELDAGLGKHNPKLSFIHYPCGQFEDSGKCVTMAVRISTSDKCPPLPPNAKLHLSLVVWDGEREVSRRNIAEKLNMSVFYVRGLITHDRLKESHSKHFHLDIDVSCAGVAV